MRVNNRKLKPSGNSVQIDAYIRLALYQLTKRQIDRHRHTDTDTFTHRHRQTDSQSQTDTHTDTVTDTHTYTHILL